MAQNPVLDIFKIRDLRNRIFFTVLMLVVFRLGAALPIPGIDVSALNDYYSGTGQTGEMGFKEYIDFFTGGAFSKFSIFMLGIMPYISTSIIMQLLMMAFPKLKKISQEDGGRKKIQKYTRYGTVIICLIQAYTLTHYADSVPKAVTMDKLQFSIIAIITVTTGTVFLMWIGEQITRRGIGNGISLIIFAGIVARLPRAASSLIRELEPNGGNIHPISIFGIMIIFVVVVALVIYEQQGQRKIPVHYAKRIVGRKVYAGQNTYIPFKINPSGVMPVIFASAILTFPLQIARQLGKKIEWLGVFADWFRWQGGPWVVAYALFIIGFAYFYTQVSLNPIEIAKQIRENGGSIPGIRTENIEMYLTKILNRIVLPGSLFLAFIAIIPTIINKFFGFPYQAAILMGGTSLLIMVGVDLDTMSQIEGHLRMHHHDGLVRKGKISSRNL